MKCVVKYRNIKTNETTKSEHKTTIKRCMNLKPEILSNLNKGDIRLYLYEVDSKGYLKNILPKFKPNELQISINVMEN